TPLPQTADANFCLLYSGAMPDANDVTRLLQDWAKGDETARDQLVPLVYGALRRLAAHYLEDERHAVTLQPTALVHEAYLRMINQGVPDWASRNHFYGVAAHLMRQVLVDHARSRRAQKRGSGTVLVELEKAEGLATRGKTADVVALSDSLDALAKIDPR